MKMSSLNTDTFKVVLISDTGEIEPVPHQWVVDNGRSVFWPPTQKLVRNNQSYGNSKPESSWRKYNCIVKVANISSFKEATEQADYYVGLNTEDESNELEIRIPKKRHCVRQPRPSTSTYQINATDYDSILTQHDEYEQSAPTNNILINHNEFAKIDCTTEPVEVETQGSYVLDTSVLQQFVCSSEIVELKEIIINSFGALNARLDNLEQRLKSSAYTANAGPSTSAFNDPSYDIFPLLSIESTNNFEKQLPNDKYFQIILSKLKLINGTGYKCLNASYKLSDYMFSKKLLAKYSWTGASRNGTKEPFNKLINILRIFYETIFYCDNTFSHLQNESFFKNRVLKHGKQRLEGKAKTTTTILNPEPTTSEADISAAVENNNDEADAETADHNDEADAEQNKKLLI